jgi:hypothetical protein
MEINNNLIKMLDPSKNYGCEVVNKAKGLYHQARNLEEKLSYDSRFRDFFFSVNDICDIWSCGQSTKESFYISYIS